MDWHRPLRPGEAVGFLLPVDRLFDLKAGNEYSLLVILRSPNIGRCHWVSRLIKFKSPEKEIPGVNRPLFGSDRFWERFRPFAGQCGQNVGAISQIQFDRDGFVESQTTLENRGRDPLSREFAVFLSVVLLRDSNGGTVVMNRNGDCSDGHPSLGPTLPLARIVSALSLGYHFRTGRVVYRPRSHEAQTRLQP